jgi:hypothetical protein
MPEVKSRFNVMALMLAFTAVMFVAIAVAAPIAAALIWR